MLSTLFFAVAILSFLYIGMWLLALIRPWDGVDLPQAEEVTVLDQKIMVYRQGQGPQILLLHGLGASAYSWRYVMQELKGEYELIAPDLVGFGLSSRPLDADYSLETQSQWLTELIKKLDLHPIVVVGSSMGGALALWLAKVHPELVPRLITLAPATLGPKSAPFPEFLFRQRFMLPLLINRWTIPWIVWAVVGSTRPLHRRSLKIYLRPNEVEPFLRCHRALLDQRLPAALSGIQAPILILWGRFDVLVSRKIMLELCQALPHAELNVLRSAHHPHEQSPELVAKEIRKFIEKNPHDSRPVPNKV